MLTSARCATQAVRTTQRGGTEASGTFVTSVAPAG